MGNENPDPTLRESSLEGVDGTLLNLGPSDAAANQESQTRSSSRLRVIESVEPDSQYDANGRYSVQRETARGGMGRVLLALDTVVGREIAIKELLRAKPGSGRSPNASATTGAERFLREARVTGQLEHPNIVPVYEIGERDDGNVFYTMKFVHGETLRDRLKAINADDDWSDRRKLRERLKLLGPFSEICNAVAFAHSRGVIHRDLKPSNIMIGEFGEVLVMDWGLAKVKGMAEPNIPDTDSGSTSSILTDSGTHTMDGAVLGTPGYMSPEQARGEHTHIDERSDVFALGAILYEILAGRPAYKADSAAMLLDLVLEGPPTPIDESAPDAPPELRALVDRAMAHNPNRRMNSARMLADEINAFRDGRALTSYSYTSGEMFWRFVRRNRASVSVGVVFLLALIAVGVWSWVSILEEQRATEAQRDEAVLAREEADRNAKRSEELAEESRRNADAAAKNAENARRAAKDASDQKQEAEKNLAKANQNLSVAYANSARASLQRGRHNEAALLAARSLALDENSVARSVLLRANVAPLLDFRQIDERELLAVALSPSGRYLAVSSWAAEITLIDRVLDQRSKIENCGISVVSLEFDHSGEYLVSGDRNQGVLTCTQVATQKQVWQKTLVDGVTSMSLNPSNGTGAVGLDPGRFVQFNVSTGEMNEPTMLSRQRYQSFVDHSWDGEYLAVVCGQTLNVMNTTTGKSELEWQASEPLASVKFFPFGTRLVVGNARGRLHLIDLGLRRATLETPLSVNPASSLDVSSDGRFAAVAWAENSVRLYSLEDASVLADLTGAKKWVTGIRFSDDSSELYCISRDGALRVWDVRGILQSKTVDTRCPISDIEVSDDEHEIAAVCQDFTIRVFDAKTLKPLRALRGYDDRCGDVLWHRGGWMTASDDGKLHRWRKGEHTTQPFLRWSGVSEVSPNGKYLAMSGHAVVTIHDTANWIKIAEINLDGDCWGLDFSPDNKRLVCVSTDGTLHIYSIDDAVTTTHVVADVGAYNVRFVAPNAVTVVTRSGVVRTVDVTTGNAISSRKLDAAFGFALDYHAGLNLVAVGLDTGAIQFRDPMTLDLRAEVRPFTDFVPTVCFSKSGDRLFTHSIGAGLRVVNLSRLMLDGAMAEQEISRITGDEIDSFRVTTTPNWKRPSLDTRTILNRWQAMQESKRGYRYGLKRKPDGTVVRDSKGNPVFEKRPDATTEFYLDRVSWWKSVRSKQVAQQFAQYQLSYLYGRAKKEFDKGNYAIAALAFEYLSESLEPDAITIVQHILALLKTSQFDKALERIDALRKRQGKDWDYHDGQTWHLYAQVCLAKGWALDAYRALRQSETLHYVPRVLYQSQSAKILATLATQLQNGSVTAKSPDDAAQFLVDVPPIERSALVQQLCGEAIQHLDSLATQTQLVQAEIHDNAFWAILRSHSEYPSFYRRAFLKEKRQYTVLRITEVSAEAKQKYDVRINDLVWAINGTPVRTLEDAVQIVNDAQGKIRVIVRRMEIDDEGHFVPAFDADGNIVRDLFGVPQWRYTEFEIESESGGLGLSVAEFNLPPPEAK